MELTVEEIKKIIPHRFPFLLIDRVTELKPNEMLCAIKNVTVNEPFFTGHFPKEKIMPGVLIVEAMAQAGCVYFYYSKNLHGRDIVYYLAKVTAKFHRPVVPGDRLRIEVRSIKLMRQTGFLKTRAFVGEELAAEAEIGFGVKDA